MGKPYEYPTLEAFLAQLFNLPDNRATALTDEVQDQTVDTCHCADTDRWETGIRRHDTWIIVEQYEDGAQASAGHTKWVAALRANPAMELPNAQENWDEEVFGPCFHT